MACDRVDSAEAHRLEAAINRMLARLEAVRRDAGRAADRGPGARAPADRPGSPRRGQPGAHRGLAPAPGLDRARPRGSPPRADRDQAPGRPGHGGAPRARPPAATRRARRPRPPPRAAQPRCATSPTRPASRPPSTCAAQSPSSLPSSSWSSTASPRRACPTSPSTRARSKVDVELSFDRTHACCGSATTGGASPRARDGGLGLSGMRERALLAGGHLSIWSGRGHGTRVELTLA